MSTFIGQLIGFAVILWVLGRYVVPPLRRMMTQQQQVIQTHLDDSVHAQERLDQSVLAQSTAQHKADKEARQLTDDAHLDAQSITEQSYAQAEHEVERIKHSGQKQIAFLRASTVRQLRADMGIRSVARAEELIRGWVAETDHQRHTVDQFLDTLEQMNDKQAGSAIRLPILRRMRSTSGESLTLVLERFAHMASQIDATQMRTVADNLTQVAILLNRHNNIARHLVDPDAHPDNKTRFVRRLFAGKIDDHALDLVIFVANQRWSVYDDVIATIEYLSYYAVLYPLESTGKIDKIQDQLCEFERLLADQPQLDLLLSEEMVSVDRRAQLVRSVIGQRAEPITIQILTLCLHFLHGHPMHQCVAQLLETIVVRRGELMVHACAASPLTEAQQQRLTKILVRLYHHRVHLQFQIDPSLLGGLRIEIADDVIDGSLAARLKSARTHLPDVSYHS